jgi:Flp pilus assembly pilin Flp
VRTLIDLVREDDGQDLAEYSILLVLITLVVIGGVTLFGSRVSQLYNIVAGAL